MASALERAALAVSECIDRTWDIPGDENFTTSVARAVLMAVISTLKRYDSDQAGQYEDERGDYVLFADLDAILNEKDTTND